jgi:hypothetical protein
MEEWIPFKEGLYEAERACFLSEQKSALILEDPVVSVFLDARGRRQMAGQCRVENVLLVKLLDEEDRLDLALDFGGRFKYLMKDPILQGGKLFTPGVRSTLQFIPRTRWEQLSEAAFHALWYGLHFIKG